MIIKCFRCGKDIDSPGIKGKRVGGKVETYFNADYVMAEDTQADEERAAYEAVKHTETTLKKKDKGEPIDENEYERVPIVSPGHVAIGQDNVIRVEVVKKMARVQKTGIVCPDCYRPTDTVIWGAHKAV
ncbi:MAG: hypothetical protein PHU08_00305 [Dehalococcoidales bacterium]|nr:hypothetical protein [Dehalococcoidales bacterium]